MVKDKNVTITVTDETLDYLVEKGFDPKMGARPLQRVIDKEIKRPLARELLFGVLKEGGKLTIDLIDNEISLKTEGNKVSEKV
jgi:ATP-dependent Clp protease ATP-binding subunit ClpA